MGIPAFKNIWRDTNCQTKNLLFKRWATSKTENSSRQQETTAFGRGGMRHRVAGMSPHMGVGKGTTGFARGAP